MEVNIFETIKTVNILMSFFSNANFSCLINSQNLKLF